MTVIFFCMEPAFKVAWHGMAYDVCMIRQAGTYLWMCALRQVKELAWLAAVRYRTTHVSLE